MILITGGAGFIGSALIREIICNQEDEVLNVDKLTYAGNIENLGNSADNKRYNFECIDICNKEELTRLFDEYKPSLVIHLAAESHVDKSINAPDQFIQTNIIGTYNLLEVSRSFWNKLDKKEKENFFFYHVSTDEVFGDLELSSPSFSENSPYKPSSPYAASKAASDHLVRSWFRTFDLPIKISNCSNNYGPYQYPEKLIPLVITNALKGLPIPVYGKGNQIRDWLYVEDHVRALYLIVKKGLVGETYNIGGHNEMKNIEVIEIICSILDEVIPKKPKKINSFHDLISFVADRPGHDQRYAIDSSKVERILGWRPAETFDSGIRKTIEWHLTHMDRSNSINKKNLQILGFEDNLAKKTK